MTTLEGFLATSGDGRTRVLLVDGGFVDVARDQIVATGQVGVHPSGLPLWRVDHTDSSARRQRFTDADLDALFVAEGYQPFSGTKTATGGPCIPPTIPDCEKSDFRNCIP